MAVPSSRYVLFFSIAAAGCAADLLSKQLVFQWRGTPSPSGPRDIWWLLEGYVGVETAVNTGGLFGIFAGHGVWLAGLSILAAIGVLCWLFVFGAASDRSLTLILALVSGGVLGNMYDRLGFWWNDSMPIEWRSGVRDWILLEFQGYTWPNFNIVDSLLVCGAALLFWRAFVGVERPEGSVADSPALSDDSGDKKIAR